MEKTETQKWLAASAARLMRAAQEFEDDVRLDPLTGRRAPAEVVRPDRGARRIAAFGDCVEALDRLPPFDRDVVVRRLRAYYCTPEPAPDADA